MASRRKSSLATAWAALATGASLVGLPAIAGTPHVGDMTEYKMPGYTLVAVDNGLLRKGVAMLPRLRRTMERVFRVTESPTGIPTYIFVVPGGIWDRYLEPSPGIPSEFVPTRFANYIIASNTKIQRIGLFHEYSHLFMRTQFKSACPLWVDEGVAMLMSNAQYLDGKTRFGPAAVGGVGTWIPTERVLRVTKTSPEYLIQSQSDFFHYQSALMLQRALIDDVAFGRKLMTYVQHLNELKTIDEALSAGFHVDAKTLDLQVRGYLSRSLRHTVTLEIGDVKDEPLVAGRKLSRQEALLATANVVIETGFGIAKAHELLDEADEIKPASGQTPVLRLRLAARRGDDTELERLYAGLQPRFAELDVARAVGLALHRRVLDVEKFPAQPVQAQLWLERTLELLSKSLAARPDDAEAVWSYAMAAAALKRDIIPALQRIEPIAIKMPRNADIAQAAALLLEATGNRADALPILKSMFRIAPTFEQRRWAANRIAEIEASLAAVK